MKYTLLSSEEIKELAKTASKEDIIERIIDIMAELGRVTDKAPNKA